MNLKVRFFNGGFCRQLLAFVDRRTWRIVRFHAVFLAIHHPTVGWIVIDTGYGGRFHNATRRWPYRLYRYGTPAIMAGTTAETLREAGINAAEVAHVIITHFHADHVGGLMDFPSAWIYHHADAWRALSALTPFRQTRSAFLPDLLPSDFRDRSREIPASAFTSFDELPFLTHDLFGDGVIRLVYLPGHAPGHVGVLLQNDGRRLFYAVDAYWRFEQIADALDVSRLAHGLQWDPVAYDETIRKLREVQRSSRYELLACHDPITQAYVEP